MERNGAIFHSYLPVFSRVAMAMLVLALSACGGEGGLSRSEAEQAIKETWNAKGDFPTVAVLVGEHFFHPEPGGFAPDTACFPLMEHGMHPAGYLPYTHPKGDWRNWQAASKAGYLTVQAQEIRGRYLGSDYTAIKCTIWLTDKANALVKEKAHDGTVTLRAVEGADVDVTGVTKPSQGSGQTVSEVQFTYKYRLNPLGKALAEPAPYLKVKDAPPKEGQPGQAVFKLYDDGWRLEGSRNF